jgi:murein L,D-transpeptidase YafK
MISSLKRNKRSENEDEKSNTSSGSDDDDSHFSFNYANSAFANSTLMTSSHSLMNNVIYDSNCSQSLIFDKIRFLNDLTSSNDKIKISDDQMQIERYEIMRVWRQLKNKTIEMTFKETAYISTCSVTLVSQSKLEKEKFDRDSHTKTLIHLKTDMQVCEIQKRFEVQLLEYFHQKKRSSHFK